MKNLLFIENDYVKTLKQNQFNHLNNNKKKKLRYIMLTNKERGRKGKYFCNNIIAYLQKNCQHLYFIKLSSSKHFWRAAPHYCSIKKCFNFVHFVHFIGQIFFIYIIETVHPPTGKTLLSKVSIFKLLRNVIYQVGRLQYQATTFFFCYLF